MKYPTIKILIPFLVFLGACNFDPMDKEFPGWNAELLGPLVKNKTMANEIIGSNTFSFQYQFDMTDLGFAEGNKVKIPRLDTALGPYHFTLFKEFNELKIEGGNLSVEITNNLPVDLLAGSVMILESKVSGDVILRHEFDRIIESESGNYTINIPNAVQEAVTGKELYFYLNPMITEGTKEAVLIREDRSLKFGVNWEGLNYQFAITQNDSDVSFSSIAEFNLRGNVVKSQPVNGLFTLYVNNNLPISVEMQAYFLGEDQERIIDSLFLQRAIVQSAYLTSGGITQMPRKSKFSVRVNADRIREINKAHYLRTYFKMTASGNGNSVKIQEKDFLAFQLVGEFNLDVEEF